ncbi:hypothetical protein [Formosa haliotis]|uniref:hypothetical protein n=1 Tax=Formosa haliotis TaxID=1555194 RepID=UPI0008243D9A|nr:hypothetical protein [Formosa haliotis]
MSKLDKYTEEEWNKIAALPQLVGGIIAGADSSGLVGTTKEMFATAKSYIGAREKYPNNTLIQAIVPNTKDPKVAMEDAKVERNRLVDQIKAYGVKSKEELATKVLAECSATMNVLKEKESDETVNEFKTWLLEIADNVAHAGTEGDFLGFGGVKFSDKEKAVFNTLKETLQ